MAGVQSDQEEAEEARIKMRHHRKVAILDSDSEIENGEPALRQAIGIGRQDVATSEN